MPYITLQFDVQGIKNFTKTAASLLAAMSKIDNSYYPEVSYFSLFSDNFLFNVCFHLQFPMRCFA